MALAAEPQHEAKRQFPRRALVTGIPAVRVERLQRAANSTRPQRLRAKPKGEHRSGGQAC
eukprot:scaffold143316_cov28-Tisochrysis_lutea.AAC.1